ncbi:MAG: glycosyltransferase family 1 protein [Patescibacteria group bacterium]|nr:glycosyltransferase family 1 protein [Patescibacteria group bacterium]
MKIGIDARSLLIEQKEGMHVYADNVIRQFSKWDRLNSYLLFVDKTVPENIKSQFPDNFHFVTLRPKYFWPQTRLTLRFLIKRAKDTDVFYFPTQSMSLWCPKNTLAIIHDVAYLKFPEYFTSWNKFVLSRLTTNFTVRLATKLICVSEQTRKDVIEHYKVPENKIIVIPHGYDPNVFYVRNPEEISQAKNKYGISKKYIAYLGTLQKRKNIVRLIEAYNWLRQNHHIDHQLIIVGKRGWLYQDIFARVKALGLEKDVIFTGYAPINDAAALLSGAGAYVLPSLYEGFGIPVIEAMAAGAPVVVSNTSSLPEVAGQAAEFIQDPYDHLSIARSLWSVINNPARQNDLKQAGFEQAKKFSWEKCARETLDVITSLK